MDTVSLVLAIIGAINWGLMGLFRFDLVAWIFLIEGLPVDDPVAFSNSIWSPGSSAARPP